MEYVYPAMFTKEADGAYAVCFPNIKGAHTCGNNLKEALDFAEDCLGGLLVSYEENGSQLPKASSLTDFPANTDECFVTLIKVDLAEYKRKINDKPVRKTVYIPKGLNDEAELQGINFSKVLRDALNAELDAINSAS